MPNHKRITQKQGIEARRHLYADVDKTTSFIFEIATGCALRSERGFWPSGLDREFKRIQGLRENIEYANFTIGEYAMAYLRLRIEDIKSRQDALNKML